MLKSETKVSNFIIIDYRHSFCGSAVCDEKKWRNFPNASKCSFLFVAEAFAIQYNTIILWYVNLLYCLFFFKSSLTLSLMKLNEVIDELSLGADVRIIVCI